MRIRWCSAWVLALALAWPSLAVSQDIATPGQNGPGIECQELSPKQQQLLGRFEAHWSELPPGRQVELSTGAERWLSMSSEQAEQVRGRFQRFRDLPAERHMELRERWLKTSREQRQRARERMRQRQLDQPQRP